jgi:hypothetical protein
MLEKTISVSGKIAKLSPHGNGEEPIKKDQ